MCCNTIPGEVSLIFWMCKEWIAPLTGSVCPLDAALILFSGCLCWRKCTVACFWQCLQLCMITQLMWLNARNVTHLNILVYVAAKWCDKGDFCLLQFPDQHLPQAMAQLQRQLKTDSSSLMHAEAEAWPGVGWLTCLWLLFFQNLGLFSCREDRGVIISGRHSTKGRHTM